MHILLYANSFYMWLVRLNILFIVDADVSSYECALPTIAFIGPQSNTQISKTEHHEPHKKSEGKLICHQKTNQLLLLLLLLLLFTVFI